MNRSLSFEVVTMEGTIVREENVDVVVVHRSEEGGEAGSEVAIHPSHGPLLAGLPISAVRYRKNERTRYLVVAGGFLRVKDNQVSIVTPAAEPVETVDLEVAAVARKRAEEWLEHMAGRARFDLRRAEAELKGAMARASAGGLGPR